MKSRMIISLVIITMALAAITGGTLAWFTAQSNDIVNTFTAGTLTITASEQVSWNPGTDYDGSAELTAPPRVNWNPGDCDWKEFTIINTGTKGIYLRVKFTSAWEDGLDTDNVIISPMGANWTLIGDYYYYKGDIDGTSEEPIEANRTIDITLNVCLDGRTTDNEYQGKDYTFSALFQAIQRSHDAVMDDAIHDGWGVGFVDDDWYEVTWNVVEERWEANGKYWDGEFWVE